MRFENQLGRSVRAFWATSYSFDMRLFNQYLLRRFAQSPLNAVVLMDQDKLASVWEHLDESETYLARPVGRRYLLRGIQLPGGGAFHPKTYLFAQADHATLVVGSGNLTRGGIDHGHETFTTFTTQRDEHLPSMRKWAEWTGQLVQMQDDELLTERWIALRESCPWMLGATEGSELLTNEDRALADQLIERLPGIVSELHLTAPFFDHDAVAVGRLIAACSPQAVTLYLGADVSVHGPSLASVISDADHVRIRRFHPRRFVHAKLIGACGPDQAGVLLSGSPNLSNAALTLTYRDHGGNCEIAILRSATTQQIQRVFDGSGLDLVDESLETLADLRFTDHHPTDTRPFSLRSAQWRKDGRVQLQHVPDRLPADVGLGWNGAAVIVEIGADQASAEPLTDSDPLPFLVRLVDSTGTPVSNRVTIDDPVALHETLVGSSGKSTSRPSEMDGLEMVPLVRLVLWAHEKFIFDPDETTAFRRAQEAAGEDANAEDADEFWKRYAIEELQYDPRSQTYKPLTPGGSGSLPIDELLRELQLLLHAAPSTNAGRVLRLLTQGNGTEGDGAGTGTPWSMEARQRIRAYHLLMRWTTAVADPRHALIAPHAPAVNYETLLSIVLLAWVNEALEIAQLRKLLRTLLDAFIGPDEGHGFLGRLGDPERAAALAYLDSDFVEIAAGLTYVALTAPGWAEDIYDWQPAAQRGVELGVIRSGPLSESVVLHLTNKTADEKTIHEILDRRLHWIDDATWCKQRAAELGLQSIFLEPFNNPKVPVAAKITGPLDFLHDPRVMTIARRVVEFKHLQAVAVKVGNDRFIFIPGEDARAVIGGPEGQRYKTDEPAGTARLKEIEEQGGALADLFRGSTRATAA